MRNKVILKNILLFTTLVIILLIHSNPAKAIDPDSTGLCLNPEKETVLCSAQPVKARDCCTLSDPNFDQCLQAYFRPGKTADEYRSCDFGMCLFTCQQTFLLQCNDPVPPTDFIPAGVSDDRINLCQPGCCRMTLKTGQNACEYFIAKNTCDAKTQTPNSLITSADFFITPSENSCNALCTGTLPTGAITGIITDKTSGAKIPDAQIEISDKKATTTTDGKYTISNVAATSQIIKISKDGYDVVTQLIVIQKDESITLDVPLKRSTAGSLRGLVKANNGSALRGVVVSYAGKEAITNPSGFYEISGLNKGIRGVLSAIKPGFSSFTDNDVEIPFETIFTYPDIVLNQVPECRQNERINSNSASQCKCGEVVMPNTDSGFCCFKEGTAKYSTASCQNLLRINGKVTALETGSFLTGVRVTIQPTSGGTQFFDFTEAGTYEVVLPSGNYQIIAEDLSGTPKFKRFNSSLLIDQNKTFDIKMLNALGACDSGNITNVNVFAVNVR